MKKTVLIKLLIFLLLVVIFISPALADRPDSSRLLDLFRQGEYGIIIDSLPGITDFEKFIKARSWAAIGDTADANLALGTLCDGYLPAAALYKQMGKRQQAYKTALACQPASGFEQAAVLYLRAITGSEPDSTKEKYWRILSDSPVEVFSQRAFLGLATAAYNRGRLDSAIIFANNIEPNILSPEERGLLFFTKSRVLFHFHDFTGAEISAP